jgi:dihydroorotate dehydrogenase (NAD+) catalytic subunit
MLSSLKTEFLGVSFKNPLVLPSGILQEISDHFKAEESGAGGVTTKSLTVEPREGNPLPRVITYEYGVLNSVGLRNPGLEKGIPQIKAFIKQSKIPVIVSVFAISVKDFQKLAEAVSDLHPNFIELNLSCPNTVDELGQPMGMGVESTNAAVKGVRKVVRKKDKLIAKLSPNVPNIGEVARAAEEAGVDAISAINTVGPGMVIDIRRKKPLLGNKVGGVSGPGIRPIAVRCVWDIYESVKVPILGMGGVTKWQDVVEMMMAGATLVGVGVAVYKGYELFDKIKSDLKQYMKEEKLKSLDHLVGAAHDN